MVLSSHSLPQADRAIYPLVPFLAPFQPYLETQAKFGPFGLKGWPCVVL